jgi:hypothetical protein
LATLPRKRYFPNFISARLSVAFAANQRGAPVQRLLMTFVLVVFLPMQILPARSDEVPVLNVKPLCRGIVSQSDTPLEAGTQSVTIEQCLQAEQVDRESIKREWSTFSASDKIHCTAEAKMGGESSYTDLLTCLEMARDVRKMHEAPAGKKID